MFAIENMFGILSDDMARFQAVNLLQSVSAMRSIEAHLVQIEGRPDRYRVTIPPSEGHPKPRQRWFKSKEQADAFARRVNDERFGRIEELYRYTRQEQVLLVMAYQKAGGAQAVFDLVAAAQLKANPLRLCDAIEKFLADRQQANRSPVYVGQLKTTFRSFSQNRRETLLTHIKADHIRDWLRGVGGSPDTRRAMLTRVRSLFNFAILNGWAFENPGKTVSMPQRTATMPRVFAPAQCKAVLDAALKSDPAMAGYFALLFFAGVRPSEARRLQPEDFGAEYLNISAKVARKKNMRRLVTITPALRSWIEAAGGAGAVLPVGPNWRKRFRKAIKAAGVEWSNDVARHSFVSYMNELHGWEKTVKEAGHSLAMMLEHYRALVTHESALSFWQLKPESVLGEGKETL